MTSPTTRAVRLGDIPDPGPRSAGTDLETYKGLFQGSWESSANAHDPMPVNWEAHVAMLHDVGVPYRELLGHIRTVCAPDYDDRWCCTNCSFAHVVELCHDNLNDLQRHRFGLDGWEGSAD